jgi:hypothetical protein
LISITPTVNEDTKEECPGNTPNSPSLPGRDTDFTSSLKISPSGVTIDNFIVSIYFTFLVSL